MDKTLIKRMAMVLIGTFIMSISVALSIYAGFGTDPCTCLVLGISRKFNQSFGLMVLVVNGVFLAFTFFFDRHLIGFGTIVNMSAIGFLVDLFNKILARLLPQEPELWLRIVCMVLGVLILSFTAALYMYPRLGTSPYDSVSLMVTKYSHIEFRWCRIVCDTLSVLIGWLCGSTVGMGTVITAFCLGPFIKYFTGRLTKRFPLPLAS
ncbi:YczE/YyaS/YitT family protein [Caproiciproducens galactitolivorans]|mgnify:CR=1 FL=1|uniref:YitT family protein n=1 Tax=Caproiciproducens galactitolivorans TaxID=642589 RepID=A0ABT4BZC7_9FIRM|nr:YitT family protein [Caproiciproducens galactitolivorans]MCY1715286.1 YitT family protein [Caproiciproducens galactitolivorans]